LLKLSKYVMTAAHEISATREPIGNAEKRHRDFQEDFDLIHIDLTCLF